MLSAVAITMVVESLTLAVGEPPPETLAWFTCGEVAVPSTLTVTVIGCGYAVAPASASLREQVLLTQDHGAAPVIETKERPDGSVSVTVTVPLVAAPPTLETVMV